MEAPIFFPEVVKWIFIYNNLLWIKDLRIRFWEKKGKVKKEKYLAALNFLHCKQDKSVAVTSDVPKVLTSLLQEHP